MTEGEDVKDDLNNDNTEINKRSSTPIPSIRISVKIEDCKIAAELRTVKTLNQVFICLGFLLFLKSHLRNLNSLTKLTDQSRSNEHNLLLDLDR